MINRWIGILLLISIKSYSFELSKIEPGSKEFKILSEEASGYIDEKITKMIFKVSLKPGGQYLWVLNVQKEKFIKAFLLSEDHGGYLEKVKFQDFENVMIYPEFIFDYCGVSDFDEDGIPEFYLTYFTSSDGLDKKPLKLILYKRDGRKFLKYKTTAYYPWGNEEDIYRIEPDANWSQLPESIRKKSEKILSEIKDKKIVENIKW